MRTQTWRLLCREDIRNRWHKSISSADLLAVNSSVSSKSHRLAKNMKGICSLINKYFQHWEGGVYRTNIDYKFEFYKAKIIPFAQKPLKIFVS